MARRSVALEDLSDEFYGERPRDRQQQRQERLRAQREQHLAAAASKRREPVLERAAPRHPLATSASTAVMATCPQLAGFVLSPRARVGPTSPRPLASGPVARAAPG